MILSELNNWFVKCDEIILEQRNHFLFSKMIYDTFMFILGIYKKRIHILANIKYQTRNVLTF